MNNKLIFFLIIFLLTPSAEAIIVWTQKTDMPTGRDGLGIGVVDGIVYCIGGWTGGSLTAATGVVEAYDPLNDTWSTKAPMPTPRGFLAVCVLDDKIYAIGGHPYELATVEVYDPRSDTWSTRAPMQTGKFMLGAEVVDGKIYAMGTFSYEIPRDVVEEYDPTTNTWTYKTFMPSGRCAFASEVINNKIYIAGGWFSPSSRGGPTYVYDPAADTIGGIPWQIKADIPTGRYHCEAGVIDGKMYVCGGLSGGEQSVVEVYDPISNTWTSETPMPHARREHDVGVIDNKLYVIGGWPSSFCHLNEEGEVYFGIKEDQETISSEKDGLGSTIVSGPLILPEGKNCRVFDITGRVVARDKIGPGIYFIEIDEKVIQKVIKIR